MNKTGLHTFHIPVMGLAFTIDTPLKVAHLGISSVISIMDDELLERMRELHCRRQNEEFIPIVNNEADYRARRITAYLNLIHKLVTKRTEELRQLPFGEGKEVDTYFELLPGDSPLKDMYEEMKLQNEPVAKTFLQNSLRKRIEPGAIDVNIMSKVDKLNFSKSGEVLPREFSDALSSLRGFANSELQSSVILSAGYNPLLYGYIENFPDFFPDEESIIRKKVILKVSDYRSAITQGKILAKKGIWVSEFRIESGLNCGGHAFATEGLLLGPILEEFSRNRQGFSEEIFSLCQTANQAKGRNLFRSQPAVRITVQGGIGTAGEHDFLLRHYRVDSTGWGSPFLLVPEVTSVDESTLQQLARAKKEDYYLSNASPLGIPFYNFRKSSSEKQRLERIRKNRPGSPCYKKFLSFNTEFTETPICTASRQYQDLKIKQLRQKNLPPAEYEIELNAIVEKDCLCEGLAAPAYLKNSEVPPHSLKAVTICPGPNLAYFTDIYTLKEMVGHIYGRTNLLKGVSREHMFVNELNLYIDYFEKELNKKNEPATPNRTRYLNTFYTNLMSGINYYRSLPAVSSYEDAENALSQAEVRLKGLFDRAEATLVKCIN